MLTEISCDKFGKDFRTIRFHKGLNTILGNSSGSNALGKTTFLWILDYVFGGTSYCSAGSDVKQYVKDHVISFTFNFDGTDHYFSRNTATPRTVCRCDKAGHLIQKLSLDEYRQFLKGQYHSYVRIVEVAEHFFRIYGRGNTYEKEPYVSKRTEVGTKAVDFLIKLFGHVAILNAIQAQEEEFGFGSSQWKDEKKQTKSFKKIEENEQTIQILKARQKELMEQNENVGLERLGFDNNTFERISKMQKEIRKLSRRRNQLKSRLDTIRNGNSDFLTETLESDFAELNDFFPGTNLKAFKEIENFHSRIRDILREEMEEEISSLEPIVARCDTEICRLKEKIESSGIASEISQRILSQCVSISKRIGELESENQNLLREKELQEAKILAERKMEKLYSEQKLVIETIKTNINTKLKELNDIVTGGNETAPVLSISSQKEIDFGTDGNTSQGTACKSLVLYDLAILLLTRLPVLIHDGNLLRSISTDHFEKLLKLYNSTEKQVFIAVDKAENEILKSTAVLKLSEGHELFGFSWSRKDKQLEALHD
ncbi:MAG: DUF2326 domain-containing protein [Acidaminococcaceae bacterium]|nr:DUF2326 domain-containing protein [Acidaminococcaceae bacterium]